MRRAPHEGQNPRRLQEKATSFSWTHSAQRSRRNPRARMPHSRKASNSSLTNWGKPATPPGFDLGEERLEMFLHQAIQRCFFWTPPLVVDWACRRGAPERWAHEWIGALFGNTVIIYSITDMSPDQFAAAIKADMPRWGKRIKEAGIRGE